MSSSPSPSETAPTRTTRRGPNRSTAGPDSPPRPKKANVVSEKTAAVAPRPDPRSALTGRRNAPNEYAIPKVVAIAVKATATARQPAALSRSAATQGVYQAAGR